MKWFALRALTGLLALSLLTVACSLIAPTPTAVRTVVPPVSGTQAPPAAAPTMPPIVVASPTATSIPPEAAPSATPTPGAACANRAAFVADVTVPDGTAVASGQAFNKTWRVRNTGTCAWSNGYTLTFVTGQAMTATTRVPVPPTAPGKTADLTVPMQAPVPPGTYSSFWELRAADGTRVGMMLWATIRVLGAPAPAPALTPSAAAAPGVYVTRVQLDPEQPGFNEEIGFRVTMLNTTGSAQTYRWFVKIYRCTQDPCPEDDLKRSIGESTVVESLIPPGSVEVVAPKHWHVGTGACTFVAVPQFLDPVGQGVLPFPKEDGNPLFHVFRLCQ